MLRKTLLFCFLAFSRRTRSRVFLCMCFPHPPQLDFGYPVPDTLVGAFSHVTEGDVFYKRGLFADALKRYTQCVDTAGAFEGAWSLRSALQFLKLFPLAAVRVLCFLPIGCFSLFRWENALRLR